MKARAAELQGLDKEIAAKNAAAKEALQSELADLEAKAKDAEKRCAAAEKALESLKAKLG